MFYRFALIFICFLPWTAIAQTDTTLKLSEVTITGIREENTRLTSLHIEQYKLDKLEQHAPFNLSDALARIPGISQMTTGISISKPVIRGLYGQRILVLLSGLRFDNQQWQDEHGLGLSQIGIDRVEIIKGPASILYGTDAIGGVINVIEETPRNEGTELNINTRLYSNTRGSLTDIGVNHKNKNSWWRLRGGYESHGDYSDGSGERVLNSRNTGYYLKAGAGFTKGKWMQNNAYNFSYNQYGFILPDLRLYLAPDARYSRNFEGPHHIVMLNSFSSQNTFALSRSTLKVNVGAQSNRRSEDEGGGAISLDMHLLSLLQSAKWEKPLGDHSMLVVNQQITFENNTNYGQRKLIPDANMAEGNLSAFIQHSFGKLILEGGAGLDYKQIKTFKTAGINDGAPNVPDSSIHPFNNGRMAGNAMLGITYNPSRSINLKANISTGNRMANLAELSSNGLHEGVYRYEIGNPDFKMEQNLNMDLGANISDEAWSFSASGYYNRFFNYIYLSPTNQLYQGLYYQFRFRQQDASLYGGEVSASYRISAWIQVKEAFSMTEGLLDNGYGFDNGRYLPFIPANRSTTSVSFQKDISRNLTGCYFSPELQYILAQNHPAMFETATPDYAIVNIQAGATAMLNYRPLRIKLSCNNLLNKTYADHLSRLKYYGINNPGINFVVSLSTDLKL